MARKCRKFGVHSLALAWGLLVVLCCVPAQGARRARKSPPVTVPVFTRNSFHMHRHHSSAASRHSHANFPAFQNDKSSTDIVRAEQPSGDYFTVIGVGTPAQYMHFMLDMGSDLTWMQCLVCTSCYDQEDPIFDPLSSSTIGTVKCAETATICPSLPGNFCVNDFCYYNATYADGTTTQGTLMVEKFTFGADPTPSLELSNVLIGCSTTSQSDSLYGIAVGILAMGAGHYSLPSKRLASFSYCLPSLSSPTAGFLTFDDNPGSGAVNISGAVSIPFIRNTLHPSYYYVSVAAISMGKNTLKIPIPSLIVTGNGDGGVILNAGVFISELDPAAYSAVTAAYKAVMGGFLRVDGSPGGLDTCFKLPNGPDVSGIPPLEIHFDGGAVLSPPNHNLFVDMGSGTHCLAFRPAAPTQKSVLGAHLQQGFKVTFDLDTLLVHFIASSC